MTGVLFSFVTLFFLITGLLWTGVWGAKVSELATDAGALYPTGLYDGASSKTVADTVKNGKAAWAAGALPLADSAAPTGAASSGGVSHDHSVAGGHDDAGAHAETNGEAESSTSAAADAPQAESNAGNTGSIPA